jgi:heat shock protein HslJ
MFTRRHVVAALASLPALGLARRASALEPPHPIERPRWIVTAIDGVPVETDPTRGPPYVEFTGTEFHAFNGCNLLNGSYARQDGRLTIRDWSTTKRACHGPTGELERLLNVRLRGELEWRIADETLTLTNRAGTLALAARPRPPR